MGNETTRATRLRFSVCTYIALAVALTFSLRVSWNSLTSSGWETPLLLLVLALYMSYDVCRTIYIKPTGPRGIQDSVVAWILLILFFMLALLPLNLNTDWVVAWCLWLLLLSFLRFSSGHRVTLLNSAPLFILAVFLPMYQHILLVISHPLRILATCLSGTILKLCGVHVAFNMTLLKLKDVDLAITDACSGIQQFEALLFLGYIIVKFQQKKLLWGVVQYAFSLPAVIFANAIRIILVVALYHWPVGENVLYSTWHEGLGYFQVILAVALMFGVGCIINYANSESDKEKKK